MRKAKAARKIVVIGSIADTPKSFFRRYQAVIRQTIDTFDKVIFAGEHATTALRARPKNDDGRVAAFDSISGLNTFLSDYLRPGDLVLLKGVENVDHLQRLILSRTGPVTCWQNNCGRVRFCHNCKHLNSPGR